MVALLFGWLFAANAQRGGCHTWPVIPSDYGPPNLLPILNVENISTLVNTTTNGKLYKVSLDKSANGSVVTYWIAHVWGKPHDWGVALGTMYKPILATFLNSMWSYMKDSIEQELIVLPQWLRDKIAEVGLEDALDFTYDVSKNWTDPRIFQELQGLSEAGGVDLNLIIRVHMIAGLTEGRCSMFGAWGQALDPSWPGGLGLLQLRALDWDMDSPVRDYGAITVYHPDDPNDGHPFALVGMVGFAGGLTGVSSKQLGISEIGVSFPDSAFGKESRLGVPFVYVLREILQYDNTIDDALNRLINEKRTCHLILGVGDGKSNLFRSVAYSSDKLLINDDQNMLPDNTTWHPRIPNIVYHGMDWQCPFYNYLLHDQLTKYYGKLNPQVAVSYLSAVERSGTNHIGIYDLTNMVMYFAFASPKKALGPIHAFERQYSSIDLKKAFNEPRP